MASRGHIKKSSNSGHVSDRSKSLIIVTAMLLLKTSSNESSFLLFKSTTRAGLNLIDLLTSDRTNTGRKRNELPRASALKRNNLLSHSELPFRMNNCLTISSRL
jgi:hypothetical protein